MGIFPRKKPVLKYLPGDVFVTIPMIHLLQKNDIKGIISLLSVMEQDSVTWLQEI
jgi:hypothetical protein